MTLNSPPKLEKRSIFMHYMHKLAVDMTFTQMTAKKSIKKHGERSVLAMYKEYKKIEDIKVMGAPNPDILTRSHNKGALRVTNLIKEKRSGKLKGGHAHMDDPRDAT